MKKSILLLTLLSASALLVGYGPRPYSDLATYKRIPTTTRTESLMKAGEDLFLRRRYEDAKSVFEMVLGMDKDNVGAKFWLSKTLNKLEQEANEQAKKALYQKWGHLTPVDKIYQNWHWGPEVGHFEVRYSEPKPYVPKVRKFRPKATDAEIKEAKKKYEASKSAEDAFELSMRYWSQRKKSDAIKYYLEATSIDPEILSKDDEYMLSMISEEMEEKIASGKANAEEYMICGRLGLLQGNRVDGFRNIIKSAVMDKKQKKTAEKIFEEFVESPLSGTIGNSADIFSFRQAYVFDKDKDTVYMRIILCPRENNQLIPIDTTIPASFTGDIKCESDDILFTYGKKGIGESTRLWLVIPEKATEYAEYEARLTIQLKREDENSGIELSNYSLPPEQPDNWSFIISSEFNATESQIPGNYEKIENGVKVSGYHLGTSEGRGPYISFSEYKEPLPEKVNIWKIIENKEDEMKLF